ncbi:MAG: hypothetical protein ONB44_11810 [candidate division KSB1 bacterium]|nr:hypothetical protein [candidate division KSB1 bacterium]MDZ7302810.1 hypothetical protein [candidate division KSB1 bacterium]MDZ7311827.1 hypothetical protein [candidate division KSB1 bacterium]
MEKELQSLYENQKEVYKFWLGFIEKIALLLGGVVLLPQITGQIQYAFALMVLAILSILALIVIMIYISRKLWYLPQDQKKEEARDDAL